MLMHDNRRLGVPRINQSQKLMKVSSPIKAASFTNDIMAYAPEGAVAIIIDAREMAC